MCNYFRSSSLTFLALFLCAGSTSAQELVETFCVIRELEEVEVPALRNGRIEQMRARRGQEIAEGHILVKMDSADQELQRLVTIGELDLAVARSKNDGDVASALAAVQRAQEELALVQELGSEAVYLEKFRLQNSLQRASADLRSAKSRLEQSQLEAKVKERELAVIDQDLKRMTINSPVSGVVEEMLKEKGEWVQQGESIMVVTRLDRLLVEGFIDSSAHPLHTIIGAEANAVFEFTGQEPVVLQGLFAKYGAAKLELDGKFPVWFEIENIKVSGRKQANWLLRPGMTGQLQIQLGPKTLPASRKLTLR